MFCIFSAVGVVKTIHMSLTLYSVHCCYCCDRCLFCLARTATNVAIIGMCGILAWLLGLIIALQVTQALDLIVFLLYHTKEGSADPKGV